MRMTVENGDLVYIDLLDRLSESGIVERTLPFVKGNLIFDSEGFWTGLRLHKHGESGLNGEYGFVDQLEPILSIAEDDQYVIIRFDSDELSGERYEEQPVNVDLIGNRVYGIEVIVSKWNDISKRRI